MLPKIFLLAVLPFGFAQKSTEPRFEDYPIRDVFHGIPAAPRLVEKWAGEYRTRIREGVKKGHGVFHAEKEGPGPNFAGHYFVITWGCGAGCLRMAIADAVTGKVYPPPESIDKDDPLALPHIFNGPAHVEYKINSRLFVMETSTNQDFSNCPCSTAYYTIEQNGFKLLKRVDWELSK